jgi:hypothetical protein
VDNTANLRERRRESACTWTSPVQRTQSRSEEGDRLVGESESGSRDSGADLTCGPGGVAADGRRRDEGEGNGDGDGEGPSASSARCNSKYSPSTAQVPILDGKHQIPNTHGVQYYSECSWGFEERSGGNPAIMPSLPSLAAQQRWTPPRISYRRGAEGRSCGRGSVGCC